MAKSCVPGCTVSVKGSVSAPGTKEAVARSVATVAALVIISPVEDRLTTSSVSTIGIAPTSSATDAMPRIDVGRAPVEPVAQPE